jgi:hypothetical protein
MHNHYYHLKKICRKKSQPLYAFKLDPNAMTDEDMENLHKHFHIENRDELKQTAYILINEDQLKLPQSIEGVDSSVSEQFIINPAIVTNMDDLYDLFEANKGTPTKYICLRKAQFLSTKLNQDTSKLLFK